MDAPYILHMLSPLRHVSPFDINMALDAGFSAAVPYTNVELAEVAGLVQDAIFSRGPKLAQRTSVFIGGRNAILALAMLNAAKKAMVPPFAVSVLADPAGSFPTAAALVACPENTLRDSFMLSLAARRVVGFGATGVVGFAAGVVAALEQAKVTLVGYDGPARVKGLAETAKERFQVELQSADGSSDSLKAALLKDAEIVLCAGRAGVQVLSTQQVGQASSLKVAADINAVPPAGIEGIGAQDNGVKVGSGLGIGALAVGGVKYGVEAGLLRRMIDSEKPLYLDFRDAFKLAREIVG